MSLPAQIFSKKASNSHILNSKLFPFFHCLNLQSSIALNGFRFQLSLVSNNLAKVSWSEEHSVSLCAALVLTLNVRIRPTVKWNVLGVFCNKVRSVRYVVSNSWVRNWKKQEILCWQSLSFYPLTKCWQLCNINLSSYFLQIPIQIRQKQTTAHIQKLCLVNFAKHWDECAGGGQDCRLFWWLMNFMFASVRERESACLSPFC